MSVTTRSPLRLAGAQLFSGGVNTGEQQTTRGGSVAGSIYSGTAILSGALLATYGSVGTGYDAILFSGAGRLNSVLPHSVISGVSVTFYDTAVATSGGPFAASGHKILAVIPANTIGAFGNSLGCGPLPIQLDVPFQSGLAVQLRSGQAGFTFTYTPEVNQAIG